MSAEDHDHPRIQPDADLRVLADGHRSSPLPLIEIGWLIAGRLEEADTRAMQLARQETTNWLRESFPGVDWQLPVVLRDEAAQTQPIEAVQLLDYGVTERNLRHWDFTIIITPADLVSHYKHDTLAVVSRSLQAAVISTARIDPLAYHTTIDSEERIRLMAQRIRALVLHLGGHLAGLEHVEDPESFMAAFETVEDLDAAGRLGAEQIAQLKAGLQQVSDSRLEEQTDVRRVSSPKFYLQAAWINRRQIAEAVVKARPWQFPLRLSRLTTAAASAMFVLMTTAEAWDLGVSQSSANLTGLTIIAIVLTTMYVIARQRLFVRREHARLSELSVVTNVSTFLIVLAGMVTTFVLLAIATFVLGQLFFQPALVDSWASSTDVGGGLSSYGKLAVFVAAIGMFIGALGATFESNHYFRHITFVDEEI